MKERAKERQGESMWKRDRERYNYFAGHKYRDRHISRERERKRGGVEERAKNRKRGETDCGCVCVCDEKARKKVRE